MKNIQLFILLAVLAAAITGCRTAEEVVADLIKAHAA